LSPLNVINGDPNVASSWTSTSYTSWGKLLISTSIYGISDSSKRASIFTTTTTQVPGTTTKKPETTTKKPETTTKKPETTTKKPLTTTKKPETTTKKPETTTKKSETTPRKLTTALNTESTRTSIQTTSKINNGIIFLSFKPLAFIYNYYVKTPNFGTQNFLIKTFFFPYEIEKIDSLITAFFAIFQRHRHQDKVPVPAQELH
jgi:hypothetical protein